MEAKSVVNNPKQQQLNFTVGKQVSVGWMKMSRESHGSNNFLSIIF